MTLSDASLRQIIRDGAGYASDARISARRKLTTLNLVTILKRLRAARKLIDDAIREIETRLIEGKQ